MARLFLGMHQLDARIWDKTWSSDERRTWKGSRVCVKLPTMSGSQKAARNKTSMMPRQRRRRRPSQVKTGLTSLPTPGERLRLALEVCPCAKLDGGRDKWSRVSSEPWVICNSYFSSPHAIYKSQSILH
jgi:hypothetical protein